MVEAEAMAEKAVLAAIVCPNPFAHIGADVGPLRKLCAFGNWSCADVGS